MRRAILLVAAALACGGSSGPAGPSVTTTGSVRGTVTDDAGVNVAGATVQLAATGKATLSTTSGSDGAFTFSSVAVGVWQVVVLPPAGFAAGSTPSVTVSPDALANAGVIRLTKLPAGGAPTAVDVAIQGFAFAPNTATVKVGGTVRWRNNDPEAHTATGSAFDTGSLTAGATSTKTFAAAGSFTYRCVIHPTMTGRVDVVP